MPQKNKKDLAQEVAHKVGLSATKTEKVLDAFFSEMEAVLADGDDVNIAGYLKLYAADIAPRAVVHPRTGKRTVSPLKRTVKARIMKSFRERVAAEDRVKGMGIILAADVEDEFAVELAQSLKPGGIRCVIKTDLREAIRSLGGRPRAADFVVIAPSVPEKTFEKTVLSIKSRRTTAFFPVLRGAFDVSRYVQPEGFKILPDHIFSSSREVARQIKGDLERWREEKHFFKRQFRLRSASDMGTINKLFSAFDVLAGRILPGADENYKLISALHEAIENAAQHGNGSDQSKYVSVRWIEDTRKVMITVEDEGAGFDYRAAVKAAEMGSAEVVRNHIKAGAGTGGLGIKLMTEVFDEVEYSNGGRTLQLTKKRPRR